METEQVGRSADRLADRLDLYVRDGAVRLSVVQRLLAAVAVDAIVRDALFEELERRGVAVDVAATVAPESAVVPDESAGLPHEPVSGGDGRPLDPVARAQAVEAARRLLVSDRIRRNPATRILTAIEEVGLTVLFRGPRELQIPLEPSYRTGLAPGSEAADAFDAMVLHNQRLVWNIAKTYVNRGLEYDDLGQSGFSGLIRAVERFDATRGLKFSTYATHWIHQSISRELDDTGKAVRLPVHVMERVRRVFRTATELTGEGIKPSSAAIARRMGVGLAEVESLIDLNRGHISFNTPVGVDGDSRLVDFIPAPREEHPEWRAQHQDRRRVVGEALASLDERSENILMRRHGWWTGEPDTLETIGLSHGVTRERIRQLEKKAIAQLEQGPHLEQLRAVASWTL